MTVVYIGLGAALAAVLLVHIAAYLITERTPQRALPNDVRSHRADATAVIPCVAPRLRFVGVAAVPDHLSRPLSAREVNRTPAVTWASVVGQSGVWA